MSGQGGDKGSRSIRALEVMEALASADHGLSIGEIMEAAQLPKATVHRLCALLEKEGFIEPDISGKGLTIGHRARALGMAVMATGSRDAYRHRILTELSEEIGETCNFNIAVGSEILYVDRVETAWPLRTELPAGSRVPLHCTASGKLYLSMLPAAKRRRLIASLPLDAHTRNSITDPVELEAELKAIRREKVGTDNEEFVDGMVAAAVPVTDGRGRLAAMLAFHAPVVRMDLAAARQHIPTLKRAAAAMSAELEEG